MIKFVIAGYKNLWKKLNNKTRKTYPQNIMWISFSGFIYGGLILVYLYQ